MLRSYLNCNYLVVSYLQSTALTQPPAEFALRQ